MYLKSYENKCINHHLYILSIITDHLSANRIKWVYISIIMSKIEVPRDVRNLKGP